MHQCNLSESGDPGWRWAGGKELTSWGGELRDPLPESWHFSHLHKCLKTMKLRDRLLKKFMSYLSSCPHLYHPCPCPYSFRHPCRSLFSSAYIQLAFFSFSYFCHVLVHTLYPCHHCHNLRASALATPVTTWRHSHLRAFKNTIFDSTFISQLNFTTAQTHYSLRGQAQHSISKTQKKRYWWKITSVVILWHKICANAKTIPRDICLQIFSHSQIQYPAPWRNQHFCAPSWDSLVTQERK